MAKYEISREKQARIDKAMVNSVKIELIAENIDGFKNGEYKETQVYVVKKGQTKKEVLGAASAHFQAEVEKLFNKEENVKL